MEYVLSDGTTTYYYDVSFDDKNIILDMVSLDEDCYVLWTFNIYCDKNYKIIWGTKQPKYNTYEEAAENAIKYCLNNLI